MGGKVIGYFFVGEGAAEVSLQKMMGGERDFFSHASAKREREGPLWRHEGRMAFTSAVARGNAMSAGSRQRVRQRKDRSPLIEKGRDKGTKILSLEKGEGGSATAGGRLHRGGEGNPIPKKKGGERG